MIRGIFAQDAETLHIARVHVYQMVTSKDASGKVLAPDQTISRVEALKLYTVNNAWFMMDSRFGSMAPGNFGDVVVLNRDLFAIPDDDIRNVSSVLTIVDGRVVHQSPVMTSVSRRDH